MPVPKPRGGESESAFVSRCISFLAGEGMEGDQAAAICYDKWRSKDEAQKSAEKDPWGLDKPVEEDSDVTNPSWEMDSVASGSIPEIDMSEPLPDNLKPSSLGNEMADWNAEFKQP